MDTPSTTQSEQVDRQEGTSNAVESGSIGKANLKHKNKVKATKHKKIKLKDKKVLKRKGKSKAKVVDSSESEDSESSSSSSSSSDSESTESDLSDSESSSASESESEDDKRRKKSKKKVKERKKASKSKRKSKKVVSESESSSDESQSGSEEPLSADESVSDELEDFDFDALLQQNLLQQQMQQLQLQRLGGGLGGVPGNGQIGGLGNLGNLGGAGLGINNLGGLPLLRNNQALNRLKALKRTKKRVVLDDSDDNKTDKRKKKKKGKGKRASKLEYKRVDQLWDSDIHNYKLTDTAQDEESSEYDQYLFNVRRTFDWEGKYKNTVVDIKSKLLKEVLNEVMDGVKGISLVEETPAVDPNLLFLYLEDLRDLFKSLKNKKITVKKGKKKAKKRNEDTRKHLKVLLKYLDKDYASTKKTLYPMLESGLITFDLLWALYKPGTLAYTTTYGTVDEPRAFKIEIAEKEASFMRGEWYEISGKYLEYDGKTWGMGTMDCDVPAFKGARKITSLNCYPLKHHKNETKIRAELIERGKKFVSLQGVQYKCHEGLAYVKRKKQVLKININGRIMVDPAIHRRMLPNYNVSTVKAEDPDIMDSDSDDSDCSCCGCDSSEDDEQESHTHEHNEDDEDEPKMKLKIVLDEKNKPTFVEVPVDENGQEVVVEKLEEVASQAKKDEDATQEQDKKALPVFTDEEYLIASPVVLGFAFAEKQWLEFTVSGIKDIVWNEGAYESLVLEGNTKAIVKALVESHKYHGTENIDDIVQGKGKGLVAVLHGPPGTGKTLTAEGISELLKCPLYMVSAGELGTDPRTLEGELQKILDIAHAWGAVLLLDEADVFLEKRTIQDIHRNALVSIFLRLLEYFQGILFLTTNRVETFDDAFQSRIHIALRYGELSQKAKKAVFKMFIERVRVLEGVETMPFTEDDFNALARNNLNGRQIKNTIRTAQALAVNNKEPLSMAHIRRVLDVSNAFERDLKGGTGYEDAMKSYY